MFRAISFVLNAGRNFNTLDRVHGLSLREESLIDCPAVARLGWAGIPVPLGLGKFKPTVFTRIHRTNL
ncbi:MAG: hypothetical protein ACRC62_20640 [Microcoleus sp.]